jgi:hypothetical protein
MTSIAGKEMTLDGSNVMYHKERVLAWERGERVAPIFIDARSPENAKLLVIFVTPWLKPAKAERSPATTHSSSLRTPQRLASLP